jgi:hypothetical protein
MAQSRFEQPQARATGMMSNPDVVPFTGYGEITINTLHLIHVA